MKVIEMIEQLKTIFKISYGMIFDMISICSGTYRRWRSRLHSGVDPVNKPGPQAILPLDFRQLESALNQLVHGSKRSKGMERLRKLFKGKISLRDLDEMVARARQEAIRTRKAAQGKLEWHIPGAVWSMDVFEMKLPYSSRKNYVLSVQDLATGYKFPPLTTEKEPLGHEIASHLQYLFNKYGRPLFLKRDNGANLNHYLITGLLSRSHVLPLNNPVYYAPYNGAIEHTQGEFKQRLQDCFAKISSFKEFSLCVELIAHELNHASRRKLQGANSCLRFFSNPRFNCSKRKRQEVFLWISKCAYDFVKKTRKVSDRAVAWRIASRIWLERNNYVTISKKQKVLPDFSEIFAHY